VDVVALDKTGTLTVGEPVVRDADDEVLRIAAGLERSSGHPIARAITRAAVGRGLPLPLPSDVVETAGIGVSGTLDGRRYTLAAGAPGTVELSADGESLGTIALGDAPRSDAAGAVAELQSLGLDVAVLSGDAPAITASVASAMGIPTHHGGLLPTDKAAWVRERKVLFVGDGLNDGPALANATVGLAMRTGAGTSLGIADGVVAADGLSPLVAAIRGARATRRAIRTNLRRSLVYNVLAVAAAAAGLVNPLVAAILMPISSAMVLYGAGAVERTLERRT
jgi:cation transport ATPase